MTVKTAPRVAFVEQVALVPAYEVLLYEPGWEQVASGLNHRELGA